MSVSGDPLRFFSPDGVADRLQVKAATVRAWLRGGRLRAVRIGRIWRVSERDFRAFLAENGGAR